MRIVKAAEYEFRIQVREISSDVVSNLFQCHGARLMLLGARFHVDKGEDASVNPAS